MELGLYTFGDVGKNPVTGETVDAQQRLRELVEEIRLADEVGLDIFGLGEHHRPNYAISSPATVLAAAASVTESIRLSSAVSVLSSDDPIRVFQQFATLDNLSGGRAELMVGRGSFIESFPLFGYDLDDYNELFEEKLAMLLAINERETLNWPGTKHTPKVSGLGVYPRPVNDQLPVWIAAGGTPQSMVRAGALGTPLALAIIGAVSIVTSINNPASRTGAPITRTTSLPGRNSRRMASRINTVADFIESCDESVMARSSEGKWFAEHFSTMGGGAAFMLVGHIPFHLGQISSWRRVAGIGQAT